LLKLLKTPMSKYGVKKNLGYPYSSIRMIINEYTKQGIVETVTTRTARTRLSIDYYQLTETGKILLRLVARLETDHSGSS